MSTGHKSGCHAAVSAFVARQTRADEFLAHFEKTWLREAGLDADRVLESIRALCNAYSHSLAPGAGCRISEEQFRREIGCLVQPADCAGAAPELAARPAAARS